MNQKKSIYLTRSEFTDFFSEDGEKAPSNLPVWSPDTANFQNIAVMRVNETKASMSQIQIKAQGYNSQRSALALLTPPVMCLLQNPIMNVFKSYE
jgi:hypothetical protein